jgi:hypothetical protein
VIWYNLLLAGVFVAFMALGYLYFRAGAARRLEEGDVMAEIAGQ